MDIDRIYRLSVVQCHDIVSIGDVDISRDVINWLRARRIHVHPQGACRPRLGTRLRCPSARLGLGARAHGAVQWQSFFN